MKIKHFFIASIFALATGLLGVLLTAGTARAATCTVPAGYTTIQAALDDSSCDTIVIAAGTFTEDLVVNRSVVLQGAGTSLDASTTRLRPGGGYPGRVIYIPYKPLLDVVVSISNLNIEDGTTTGSNYGAGINNGESLTLDNVIVTNNTAFSGGGLYASSYASTTILNSRILVNSVPTVGSKVGSNIHNDAINGTMTISNSIISNGLNSKYDIETNGPTVIHSSTITGTTTGIFASAELTLEASTVSGNIEYGLDLDNITSPYTVVITGSTVQNSPFGGIRAFRDVQLTVNNATVSGNGSYGIQMLKIGETTPVLTVTNSLIQDNDNGVSAGGNALIQNTKIYTSTGAGIVHAYGDLVVEQSDIRYHSSSAICGGGVQVGTGSTALIQESIIAFNQATNGGGICVQQGGRATVERSTIGGNVATTNGGGAYAGYLGTGSGTLELVNSTLTLNNANTNGGGIYGSSGTLTVTNVTIARNTADADTSGGGLGGGYYADVLAPVTSTLVNSLLALNGLGNGNPADCSGTITSGGTNLVRVVDGCSGFITSDITGTAVSPLDAQLGQLKNNGGEMLTIALGQTSPAVDAGQDSVCNTSPVGGLDQRHYGRANVDGNGDGGTDGDSCDIGAFERGGVLKHNLTVTKAGNGQGTVSSDPAGLDCGADCTEVLSYGTVVTLTATADTVSSFAGWAGDASGLTNPLTVTMDSDKSVIATFNVDNISPTTPSLTSPAGGSVITTTQTPTFDWTDATDGETSVVSYTLLITISNDSLTVLEDSDTVTTTVSQFTPSTNLAAGGVYTWTVQAHDAAGNVSGYASPPASFTLQMAGSGSKVYLPLVIKDQ